eukprot:3765358-Pyramimonas_sp.AAC.1
MQGVPGGSQYVGDDVLHLPKLAQLGGCLLSATDHELEVRQFCYDAVVGLVDMSRSSGRRRQRI